MTDNTRDEPPWLDLRGAMAALRRAALEAREVAARTHTYLIQVRDGKVERISPAEDIEFRPE